MENPMKTAAIYARVSSNTQRDDNTIASQTATLVAFAKSAGYIVPMEWVVQDDGYSGASLVRPGLETVRDLAAEGQIQAVLVLSPDRLSRKYAYQVLLIEELARHGVEVVFVNAPQSERPEDQLLLQFQGMIAEYERAQILERSRRGKRHRAREGQVSVLGGAPYGYRYVRKSDDHAAYYEVNGAQAQVVRQIFNWYVRGACSIEAIVRRLNEQRIPTSQGGARWWRSGVWALLRNPAYKGTACFGKTQLIPRSHPSRNQRQRGRVPKQTTVLHELPRDQWIEIAVPALIDEDTFALAQERLEDNKKFALRHTIEPSVVQGLVNCRHCGYACRRTSTRTSLRKIYYYRCLGSDLRCDSGKPRCTCRPVRQDLLDHIVWTEVVRLLEDPTLIQNELERRLAAARHLNPARHHEQTLNRELTQVRKRMERLLTAYQEDLLSLEELRRRMPELRQRERALQSEIQAINAQMVDQAAYLRLAQTLSTFQARLRTNAHMLDITERQQIVRLLVKEVLISHDSITIRHSIPNADRSIGNGNDQLDPVSHPEKNSEGKYSLLRSWSHRKLLVQAQNESAQSQGAYPRSPR
jgi:site-specific DNA recombinase